MHMQKDKQLLTLISVLTIPTYTKRVIKQPKTHVLIQFFLFLFSPPHLDPCLSWVSYGGKGERKRETGSSE